MGPLAGIRVIELAGIGPAPMASMLMADLGADVLRIERPDAEAVGYAVEPRFRILNRGKIAVALDLKTSSGLEEVLRLIERADVLVEGFRPGVIERMGLAPETCLARNPRLVLARITGWGRTGPLAETAGHDLNYIALMGALAAMGPPEGKPAIPLNLVGDYGGGSLYLVLGILSALLERVRSGLGQVVDATMIDGVASLMSTFFGQFAGGAFQNERGTNLLDGGAPFYDLYRTADGKWVSVAAIEPKFFAVLVDALGLPPELIPLQYERSAWPELRHAIATSMATRSRAEWTDRLRGSDACCAPVLDMSEAPNDEHNRQRGVFVEVDGVVQPAPTPHFSRTPASPLAAPNPALRRSALHSWGLEEEG